MSRPKLQHALTRLTSTAAALTATLSALLAVPLAAATPAYAAPTHVAIVIAGDKGVCVPWQSGMTGDSLLNSVASVTYNASHMINRIDGRPSDGASSVSAYWSYWHNTGSGWTYSSVGASDYTVPVGSVEGWIFGDGSAPPNGSYASICAGRDPVTPAAPSAATVQPQATSAPRSAVARTPASGAGSAAGISPADGSSTAAPAVGAAGSSAARAKPTGHSSGRTSVATPTAPTAPAAATSSAQTDAAVLAKPPGHGSSNSVIGTAVAALAALALAGGAFWARRRRRAV